MGCPGEQGEGGVFRSTREGIERMFRGPRGGGDGVRCSRIQGEGERVVKGYKGREEWGGMFRDTREGRGGVFRGTRRGRGGVSGAQGEGRVFRGTRERRVEWERYYLADQPLVHLTEADFQAFLGHG